MRDYYSHCPEALENATPLFFLKEQEEKEKEKEKKRKKKKERGENISFILKLFTNIFFFSQKQLKNYRDLRLEELNKKKMRVRLLKN